MDHFCMQVTPQPDEEISRYLASHGIKVAPFERRYGAQGYGNSVYLCDPEGITVEQHEKHFGGRDKPDSTRTPTAS